MTNSHPQDADSGQNAVLLYTVTDIDGGSVASQFVIDSNGTLTIGGTLDFGVEDAHALVITARDHGDTPRAVSRHFRVYVWGLLVTVPNVLTPFSGRALGNISTLVAAHNATWTDLEFRLVAGDYDALFTLTTVLAATSVLDVAPLCAHVGPGVAVEVFATDGVYETDRIEITLTATEYLFETVRRAVQVDENSPRGSVFLLPGHSANADCANTGGWRYAIADQSVDPALFTVNDRTGALQLVDDGETDPAFRLHLDQVKMPHPPTQKSTIPPRRICVLFLPPAPPKPR